jgi:hypothetical protein
LVRLGPLCPLHSAPELARVYISKGEYSRAISVIEQGGERQRDAYVYHTLGLAAEVDRITATARADEVVSTPTFVFEGGFRLTGAQEYAVFSSVTGRLLERKITKQVHE